MFVEFLIDAEEASMISERFETFGYYLLGILLLSTLLIVLASFIHDKWFGNQIQSDYVPILRFGMNVGDFWTDLLFCLVLFLDDDAPFLLFLIGIVFVAVPYVASCIVCVTWISKWRNSADVFSGTRLASYFKKYDMLIYAMTSIAGFYSTVDVCKSKLFHLKAFRLQLKQKEYNILKNYRFITIVLLENIPQLTISLYYLNLKLNDSTTTNSVTNTVSPIVFTSMLFSILAVFSATMSRVSELCQCCHEKDAFTNRIEISAQLKIETPDMNKAHTFAHNNISKCIENTLDETNENDAIKWQSIVPSGKVSKTIDVYFIQDFVTSSKSIEAFFAVNELAAGTPEKMQTLAKLLETNVAKIGVKGGGTWRMFRKAIKEELKLQALPNITMKNLVLSAHDLNNPNAVMINLPVGSKSFLFICSILL